MKGLRNAGCQVAEYNLHDELAWHANLSICGEPLPGQVAVERAAFGLHRKLWEVMPDLVVAISAFYVMPVTWQILHTRPHKTAIVFTESPYEDDRQLTLVENADPDLVVLNDPVHIDNYRAVHPNVAYLPHAYDPDVHYPGTVRDVDFSFVGTGYPSRIRLFEKVDWADRTVKFAGHWKGLADDSPLVPYLVARRHECTPNHEAADLYRRTKVSANLYRGNDEIEANEPALMRGWSMGPREVELAACGTFFLRESRGEGDELFPMLPTFESADEFSDKFSWWLTHRTQRETAAREARARIADRTFDNNARRLLELVDRT